MCFVFHLQPNDKLEDTATRLTLRKFHYLFFYQKCFGVNIKNNVNDGLPEDFSLWSVFF